METFLRKNSIQTKVIAGEVLFQDNLYARYRYTLVHEVGHLALHKAFYKETQYSNVEDWTTLIGPEVAKLS
jgi:Zn-dependent peptidase ImmA (M78 family)